MLPSWIKVKQHPEAKESAEPGEASSGLLGFNCHQCDFGKLLNLWELHFTYVNMIRHSTLGQQGDLSELKHEKGFGQDLPGGITTKGYSSTCQCPS